MAASSSSSSAGPSQNESQDAIKDWSQEEKFHLLNAFKTYGRHDVQKIQEYVKTKSFEETKAAVDHYTRVALQHPIFLKETEQRSKRSQKAPSPLTDWAKLLTDNLSTNELTTETATALRMIADLEKIPPPECTEGIDFRQVYHQLANALEGKPIKADPGVAAVLQKCVTDTALTSKAFINTAALRNIINNIDLSDKEINMLPRPTEDHELAIIRHLASQRRYNPLKIPEEHLKPSTVPEEHILPK